MERRRQVSEHGRGARLPPGLGGAAMLLLLLLGAGSAGVTEAANICLEPVSDIPATWMEQVPGSSQVALGTRDGLIYLVTLPDPTPAVNLSSPSSGSGSGSPQMRAGVATADASLPAGSESVLLDISSRTLVAGDSGLLSFAFHPDFATNGRFFVSYICNSTAAPDCQGPCACRQDLGCQGPPDCPAQTVVAEYSAITGWTANNQPNMSSGWNSTAVANISSGWNATLVEIRKVLLFGRPTLARTGGHIWFGSDKHLYYSSGDGGSMSYDWTSGDTFQASQNGKVPLGKILRLDVNQPTPQPWGTYGVPGDNPFVSDPKMAPEVHAFGLRNPRRATFDSETNLTLIGDIGEASWEELNVLEAGANYGWPYREGPDAYNASLDPYTDPYPKSATTNLAPATLASPTLAVPHNLNNSDTAGGYIYRGSLNACLQGFYVFMDNGGNGFVGTFPPISANYANEPATFTVAQGANATTTEVLDARSWATDNNNELYLFSSQGVYRMVDPSMCGQNCSLSITQAPNSAPAAGIVLPGTSFPGIASVIPPATTTPPPAAGATQSPSEAGTPPGPAHSGSTRAGNNVLLLQSIICALVMLNVLL